MPAEVVWTQPSLESLEEAVLRIRQERPHAADRFQQLVHETVDRLIDFPLIGAECDIPNVPRIRELFCSPYRIFYRYFEARNSVHVLLLWHSSRDDPTRADLLG